MTVRNVGLVLVGILIGCAASGGRHLYAQRLPLDPAADFSPNPNAPHWQQFCEEVPGTARANAQMRMRAADGWELASYAFHNGILCFKRPEPVTHAP